MPLNPFPRFSVDKNFNKALEMAHLWDPKQNQKWAKGVVVVVVYFVKPTKKEILETPLYNNANGGTFAHHKCGASREQFFSKPKTRKTMIDEKTTIQ